MQFAKLFFSILIVMALAGCAHPIVISPDVSKIERDSGAQIIQKNVGYFIMGDREIEVITAGGGGDQVRYHPYKDIETGFYKMLTNVFKSVTALKSDKDDAITKNEISYIISLDVSTNSSSPSLLTWPPTIFGVNLNCDIKDETGKNVTHLLAVGEGHAEFDEWKSDHALAGERASLDALMKMQRSLLNSLVFVGGVKEIEAPKNQASQQDKQQPTHANTTTQPASIKINTAPSQNESAADKLRNLNALYKDGVISKKDFETKKQEILKAM
jgi:hypothetical protein